MKEGRNSYKPNQDGNDFLKNYLSKLFLDYCLVTLFNDSKRGFILFSRALVRKLM